MSRAYGIRGRSQVRRGSNRFRRSAYGECNEGMPTAKFVASARAGGGAPNACRAWRNARGSNQTRRVVSVAKRRQAVRYVQQCHCYSQYE